MHVRFNEVLIDSRRSPVDSQGYVALITKSGIYDAFATLGRACMIAAMLFPTT
jgi:hypothetical protein